MPVVISIKRLKGLFRDPRKAKHDLNNSKTGIRQFIRSHMGGVTDTPETGTHQIMAYRASSWKDVTFKEKEQLSKAIVDDDDDDSDDDDDDMAISKLLQSKRA